ncbi:MAG TPA: metallophosphoesterase, partial [Polyangiales bacterium]
MLVPPRAWQGWRRGACALALLAGVGCLRPAEERAELDRDVGHGEADGVRVEVADGLATVREFDGETLRLWAQAPVLELRFGVDTGPRTLRLEVQNARRDSELRLGAARIPCEPLSERACGCQFELSVEADTRATLSPPAADAEDTFVFAMLGDVQRAIGSVHEVYERMNQDPELAFVASSGDLVNTGERSELERFQAELAVLEIPYYSTVGNHELGGTPNAWHQLFGLFNVHFHYKGVAFSLIDAGNATIDPIVYGWLADWLDQSRDGTHAVFMHIPPLDPAGLRGGGFRRRK